MLILQTSSFRQRVKKLHPNQKQDLDDAVRKIVQNPSIGEEKVGDLSSVRVYKFKMTHQIALLAYTADSEKITLLALGSHENFYRDLKQKL